MQFNKEYFKSRAFTIFELIITIFILGMVVSSTLYIFEPNSRLSHTNTKQYQVNFKLNRVIKFIKNRLQEALKESIISSSVANQTRYEWMVSARYLKIGEYSSDIKIYMGESMFVDIDNNLTSNKEIVTISGRLDVIDSIISKFSQNISTLKHFGDVALVFKNNLANAHYGWQNGALDGVYLVRCKDEDCKTNSDILEFENISPKNISREYTLITEANALIYTDGDIKFCTTYRPYIGESIEDGRCNVLAKDIKSLSIKKVDKSISVKVCLAVDFKDICKEVII
jgi:hypothetical protein